MNGRIRPFRPDDIPEVVALRNRKFRWSEHGTGDSLAAYFETVFLRHPRADETLPSLVLEDEHGRPGGFVGVLPQPMLFRGEPVRTAVPTQFMVAREVGPLGAARLGRALLSGPQDLTIADAANDAARQAWIGAGGSATWPYSLSWTKVLRPARHAAARWRRASLPWAASLALRPLLRAADALAARPRPPGGDVVALDPPLMAAGFPEMAAGRALRPCYDVTVLEWLFQRLAEKASLGVLQRVLVRDGVRRVAGWFLYFLNPGGVCELVQIVAREGAATLVLRHLWHHAWRRGAVAVNGRVEPALLPGLAAEGCRFERRGPWTLCHSRRPELELAIHRGDAFLSRLDGEWWLSF